MRCPKASDDVGEGMSITGGWYAGTIVTFPTPPAGVSVRHLRRQARVRAGPTREVPKCRTGREGLKERFFQERAKIDRFIDR